MIPLLLLAGLLAMGGPGLMRVPGRRGHPAHWARLVLCLQLVGFGLVEAGLLLATTPALLDAVGATDLALVCRRMFGGLAAGGWAGGAVGLLAVALAATSARGAWRCLVAQRRLRVEGWLGSHRGRTDHTLVILPTRDLIAYATGGRPPQVVVSQEMVETLGSEGVAAVIAHEAVHARHRHHRVLLVAAAVESAFGWFRPAARGASMLRLALERWADEESAVGVPDGRERLRRAMLTVAGGFVAPEVAGFSAAETIAERARALSGPSPRSRWGWVAAGYLTVGSGVMVSLGVLAWATWMSILAVANPGLCVL